MSSSQLWRATSATVALGIVLALAPATARAQSCSDVEALKQGGQTVVTTLALLNTRGCLGGPADKTAVTVAVRRVVTPVIAADVPRISPYASAIDLVIEHTTGPHTTGDPKMFEELAAALRKTKAALGTFADPALRESWSIDQSGRSKFVTGSLTARINGACATAGPKCTETYTSVREATRIIELVRYTLAEEASPIFREHLAATTKLVKQWGEYFDSARSQYVWELALNGLLMKDTRPVVGGVSQGFREVPTSQWMLLHPSVSFEFNKGAPDGQKLEPAVVVDILGYNRWRWKEDGSMGRAIGASLIATVADNASGNHIGWGAMFHVNHTYSAGFSIRPDGEKAFLLTADVAKLWTKVPQPVRERIAAGK